MNGNIEIRYEQHKLKSYVEDLLSLGACRLFLPAAFITEEDGILASYKTDGFKALSDFLQISTEGVFSIAIALVAGIRDAERHYIFSEDFEIAMESIYVNRQFSQVKMVFLPTENNVPPEEKLIRLLTALKDIVPDEGAPYLDDAIGFAERDGFGCKGLLHHLESLRKEVRLCGIS